MVAPTSPRGRRPGPPRATKALSIIGAVILAAFAILWILTSPTAMTRLARRTTSDRGPRGGYVGAQACRDCHPGEYAALARSGHSRTLRAAESVPLARKLDGRVVADPEQPGTRWAFASRNGLFQVTRSAKEGTVEQYVIAYAFGSDRHATTFVTLTDWKQGAALEHRLTHYAEGDSFGITPGQSAENPFPVTTPHGRELPTWETIKCFRCHSTRTSTVGKDVLNLEELIPNVSCEKCHGPAGAHVTRARAGDRELSMPFGPDRWNSESQMALCGQCHRHPSETVPGRLRPEIAELARFQPVGLMQSRCYTESAGALSCVNCHEPHSRASSDRSAYESVCLDCHESRPRITCSVSPRGGCIDCHMPRVDTRQRVLFTDHWIRVRKASDPPSSRAGRAPSGVNAHVPILETLVPSDSGARARSAVTAGPLPRPPG